MLQVARLAHKPLADSAALVTHFLHSQMNDDGGFKDRAGASDLYYTVFGLEGLLALRADLPAARVEQYLRSFGSGEGLDFIHLSCLARCWAALPPETRRAAPRDEILARVETYRTPDGTYNAAKGSQAGNLYGCFIALLAFAYPAVDLFGTQFDAGDGVFSAFGMNLMMSALFIAMFMARPAGRGQSAGIATAKLAGTAFASGSLAVKSDLAARYQGGLLPYLYISIFVLDLVYLGLTLSVRAAGVSSATAETNTGVKIYERVDVESR